MNYLRNPGLSYSVRRRLVDRDLIGMRDRLRGRVLDVGGVGTSRRGRFVPPLDQVDSWIVLNIEPATRPDVCADAEALPLPDASADVVLMTEVMEYLSHPDRVLCETARVMRSGGQFIATTPFMHRFDSPHDYQRFSASKIAQLLDEAGLRVEHIEPQGVYFAVLADMLQRPLSQVRSTLIRRSLAALTLPLIRLLLWVDTWRGVRASSFLSSYSTGYLVVAHKEEAAHG